MLKFPLQYNRCSCGLSSVIYSRVLLLVLIHSVTLSGWIQNLFQECKFPVSVHTFTHHEHLEGVDRSQSNNTIWNICKIGHKTKRKSEVNEKTERLPMPRLLCVIALGNQTKAKRERERENQRLLDHLETPNVNLKKASNHITHHCCTGAGNDPISSRAGQQCSVPH